MKFRLAVQPKPERELKFIVPPSLLSDPAFSADPCSNPYFVSGEPAWASSAPPGHPTLRDKNRRLLIPTDPAQPADDFDFQLIQPPNSPVPPSPTLNVSRFPFSAGSLPQATTVVSSSSTTTIVVTKPIPPSPPPPPAQVTVPKEEKKKRMPFLSRRRSASQVDLAVPKIQNDLNYVTQRSRPSPSSSTPVKGTPRPPSTSYTSTSTAATVPSSRSAITSASRTTGKSQDSSSSSASKAKNLDRIDELDETNPWGISLHHGGPYEAAIQGLKRTGSTPGGVNGGDRAQGLHAHPNFYVPPQIPPGVSLNLSPGQILPRNFDVKNFKHPNTKRAASQSHYRPKMLHPHSTPPNISFGPPSSPSPSPPISFPLRPVTGFSDAFSFNPPPPPAAPAFPPPSPPLPSPNQLLSNPHPEIHMTPPDLTENQEEYPALVSDKLVEDISFNIGLAMLEPRTPEISSPSVFLRPGTSGESDFDPYDPMHLEFEHSRSPSPIAYANSGKSRELSPAPSLVQGPTPDPRTPDETVNEYDRIDKQIPFEREVSHEPPPYFEKVPAATRSSDELMLPNPFEESRVVPRDPSLRRSPTYNANVILAENNRSRPDSSNMQGIVDKCVDLQYAATPSSQLEMSLNASRTVIQSSPLSPPVNRENVPLQLSAPPHPPSFTDRSVGNNREAMSYSTSRAPSQIFNPNREPRDAASTHRSISTYGSGQSRNGGPPSHRRVPKHLVMPAPLNINNRQNNTNISQPMPNFQSMSSQIPSTTQLPSAKMQVHIRSQSNLMYPQIPTTLSSTQFGGPPMRVQEIPTASSKKLRKRVSIAHPPPPTKPITSAQVMTTVSFAPPVVGFGQGPYGDKVIARSKTDKAPKGVLRKRNDF